MARKKTEAADTEAAKPDPGVARWFGIGSAAIAAAVLYANRAKVTQAINDRRRKPIEHED